MLDISSTASQPWNSRIAQSHDLTQLSVTAEGKRNENHIMWQHKQADINSHSNAMPRTPTEGGCLSSHVSVSQHLYFI